MTQKSWRAAAVVLVVLAWGHSPGVRAAESLPCAQGMELRLTTAEPTQGSVLLIELRAPFPVAAIEAQWRGQKPSFWKVSDSPAIYRALLGVDLNVETGIYPLTFLVNPRIGQRMGCSALLTVEEGEFATERLRVARRFVQLNPQNRERAIQESELVSAILDKATPERFWDGPFRPPLQDLEPRGNFGRRRFLNGQPRAPHSGEDFRADAGTPIYAVQRGRVVLAQNLFYAGNAVILDHGLGLYTFYAHLESIAVQEGELVEAETLLGKAGATGRVTGAHLHLSVRLNNARVNPLDLLTLFSRAAAGGSSE